MAILGSHVPDGRGGIRTHGTLLTYTHFPGVRLKPLGHPSRHHFLARAIETTVNGQGEIRTLDTGFTGMPVFETGAFNHSATCPTGPQVIRPPDLLQPNHTEPDAARVGMWYDVSSAIANRNSIEW